MRKVWIVGAGMLALLAGPVRAQDRAAATISCRPNENTLAYDCVARVADRESGAPLDGLTIDVDAKMPSMPMAHNIPPVRAEPTGEPGVYAFSVALEMYGAWAFSMRISGAREDLIVEVLDFEANAGRVDSGEELGAASSHDKHGDHDDAHAD